MLCSIPPLHSRGIGRCCHAGCREAGSAEGRCEAKRREPKVDDDGQAEPVLLDGGGCRGSGRPSSAICRLLRLSLPARQQTDLAASAHNTSGRSLQGHPPPRIVPPAACWPDSPFFAFTAFKMSICTVSCATMRLSLASGITRSRTAGSPCGQPAAGHVAPRGSSASPRICRPPHQPACPHADACTRSRSAR